MKLPRVYHCSTKRLVTWSPSTNKTTRFDLASRKILSLPLEISHCSLRPGRELFLGFKMVCQDSMFPTEFQLELCCICYWINDWLANKNIIILQIVCFFNLRAVQFHFISCWTTNRRNILRILIVCHTYLWYYFLRITKDTPLMQFKYVCKTYSAIILNFFIHYGVGITIHVQCGVRRVINLYQCNDSFFIVLLMRGLTNYAGMTCYKSK